MPQIEVFFESIVIFWVQAWCKSGVKVVQKWRQRETLVLRGTSNRVNNITHTVRSAESATVPLQRRQGQPP